MRLAARCLIAGIAAAVLFPGVAAAAPAAEDPSTPLDVIAEGFHAGGEFANSIGDALGGQSSGE